MRYGLYLHIPYCRSRCHYCDFHSAPCVGGVPDAYVKALVRDFEKHAPKGQNGQALRPCSVYFGGGTPGLLSAAQVQTLLQTAAPLPGAEVTLEVNPGFAEAEKLAGFYAAGVNRLSVGVQSARAQSLARLGRAHTPQDAANTLAAARAAGFTNISGDVMLALPGYSNAELDETLALIDEGGATHVSAYLLKLEKGTPMGNAPPPGLPGEDSAADFYLYACAALEKLGYAQYEISNFARPGFEGAHNLLYWDAASWLGLGPSAHSCLGGRRFSFAPDTARFLAGQLPPQNEGPLTADDYLMLRLRLARGFEETELLRRFGARLTQSRRNFLDTLRLNRLAIKTAGGWALTPRGMLVQNQVLAQLFS